MDLEKYGLPSTPIDSLADGLPARITAVHRERFALVCQHGELFARLKTGVYYGDEPQQFPTAGDFVRMQYNESGDSLIVETLPRKSFFSRKDPTPGRGEQAVAANFDYVFIISSLNQNFNLRRIERYAVAAWQSGGTPVVILTKADLVEDPGQQLRAVQESVPGVEVVAVSAHTGQGLEALEAYLRPGRTLVFLGSSGVGKSSLVNVLAGGEIMAVSGIREEDSRGRHTTTHRQLILLPCGAMIIDTPGMRELGMWNADEGLAEAFGDIEELLLSCRFSDCSHTGEPGCAVTAALEFGSLSPQRWESYNKLKREAEFSEDKAAYRREKTAFFKKVNKEMREHYRHGGKK